MIKDPVLLADKDYMEATIKRWKEVGLSSLGVERNWNEEEAIHLFTLLYELSKVKTMYFMEHLLREVDVWNSTYHHLLKRFPDLKRVDKQIRENINLNWLNRLLSDEGSVPINIFLTKAVKRLDDKPELDKDKDLKDVSIKVQIGSEVLREE